MVMGTKTTLYDAWFQKYYVARNDIHTITQRYDAVCEASRGTHEGSYLKGNGLWPVQIDSNLGLFGPFVALSGYVRLGKWCETAKGRSVSGPNQPRP